MKNKLMLAVVVLVALVCSSAWLADRQPDSSAGVPVKMVVTAESRSGKEWPVIHREDVIVKQGEEVRKVTDWVPLEGDNASMELFILMDDGSSFGIATRLDDVRTFINQQPPSTAIAVGYMRYGTVETVQKFTLDHALAAKSLRLPLGSAAMSSSPYMSVEDLSKKWPGTSQRRVIVMISDGIDRYDSNTFDNPYVDAAIEQAQRNGIIVYSIYNAGAGHYAHTFWRANWGQTYLSELSDQTGGESYGFGFVNSVVSFGPYFQDLTARLNHQYLLTFLAKPEKKAGLQQVKIFTESNQADMVAASRVYVPAGSQP